MLSSSIKTNLIFLHIILAIIPDERLLKALKLNSLFQGYPFIKELWNKQNQDESSPAFVKAILNQTIIVNADARVVCYQHRSQKT